MANPSATPFAERVCDATEPAISVVICTRDRPDTIGQAIESVVRCTYRGFDLYVMDQSTTDSTQRIVQSLRRRFSERCAIHYHHLERAGLSHAYNAAIALSDGPVIACTDDDVVVPEEWLARIAQAFQNDEQLGLLYGQVLAPASLAEAAETTGMMLPSLVWEQPKRLIRENRNFKVWGMGANMALRRNAIVGIGGFDEAMGGGAPLRSSQDFDVSLRMYRAGYAVSLEPGITVDHYGTRTREQWPATMFNYGVGDGAFYSKHARCADLLAVRMLVGCATREALKAVDRSVRARRLVGFTPYGRGFFVGIREGMRFRVDRRHRRYVETKQALFAATDPNAVTAAVRVS